MNIKTLHQLKDKSKPFSILYIESDKNYQKQLLNLFKTLFDKSYCVSNGDDAIEYVKKYRPHIVVTNLSNAKKCDIAMISDIKDIVENIQIIVLSNYNDNFELLQMIDLDIVDMLLKPLDFDKMILALKKAIITRKNSKNEQKYYDKFKNLKNNNIKLLNSYKGILIHYKCNLINVLDSSLVIEVSNAQKVAIKYQKYTIVHLEEFDIYIKLKVLQISNNLITFCLPEQVNPILENIVHKFIIPDDSFKLSIHHKNRNIDNVKIVNLALTNLQFNITTDILDFRIYDKIDLAFAFELKSSTVLVKDKVFVTAFASGIIKEIKPVEDKYMITTTFKINKADESRFTRYLKEQEIEVINEFKELLKRD